jgi:autoinducer 2-degrading protein
MYVVTVEFEVTTEYAEAFRDSVLRQARNSFEKEPDCHQFDVCTDPKDPTRFYLYEVYADEEAFQSHLRSDHFLDFDAKTKAWIENKTVRTWLREEAEA